MSEVNSRVITAHVPLPLAEQVDQHAARLDRSRGWIIRQALVAWIEQEDARSQATSEKPRRTNGRAKR